MVSKNELCWQQCFFFTHALFQARRNNGRAVKKVREMETYKKQVNRYQYFCFCSARILTSKITEMIDNHSEFSCCTNSCNKFVSIRS